MTKAKLDLDFLARAYFYFDEPVPYQLENGAVYIKPIFLKDSEIFLASCDVLAINKNEISSVEIIQMSYLEFLVKCLISQQKYCDKFINILKYCMNINSPALLLNDKGKPYIFDKELGISIDEKDFENIRRIIMYQNILHYDDSYVSPEVKEMMDEVNELKNKNIIVPNLERKIAIITSHCGLSKEEQKKMTYRSHCLLFEEVCGEVEYEIIKPVALIAKMLGSKGNDPDNWIYKKSKGKFDDYIVDVDKYSKNIGGSSAIKQAKNTNIGDKFNQSFNNFGK